jgi:hypothetical protein
MQYEPRNPHHLRYVTDSKPSSQKLLKTIEDYVIKLNEALGYDFNTVEFAVRDGVPYAIDFCNPAPDADVNSVGQENFDWVVEAAANLAIERAKAQKSGQDNLTWGSFVSKAALKLSPAKTTQPAKKATKPAAAAKPAAAPTKEASAKKAAPKKAVAEKV